MGKFDPYSRRELRRLRGAYLRRNRRVVAAITAGFAVLLAFETIVVRYVLSGPASWYLLGVVHAGLVAAALICRTRAISPSTATRSTTSAAHGARTTRAAS